MIHQHTAFLTIQLSRAAVNCRPEGSRGRCLDLESANGVLRFSGESLIGSMFLREVDPILSDTGKRGITLDLKVSVVDAVFRTAAHSDWITF